MEIGNLKIQSIFRSTVLITSLILICLFVSCTEQKDEETTGHDTVILSPELIEYIDVKKQFIEIPEFTPPEDINLSNSIKVTIECESGKAELVKDSVISFGNVVLIVDDLIQAYIPFSNFDSLSSIQGINYIRFPVTGDCDGCEE